jgi:hypothetical protein
LAFLHFYDIPVCSVLHTISMADSATLQRPQVIHSGFEHSIYRPLCYLLHHFDYFQLQFEHSFFSTFSDCDNMQALPTRSEDAVAPNRQNETTGPSETTTQQNYPPELYKPLGPSQIRILVLDQTSFDTLDDLHGKFEYLDLPKLRNGNTYGIKTFDDFPDEPCDFEALSYTWGEPVFPCRLFVNGFPLNITQNLHDGLMRLCNKAQSPLRLWIDAVCINQTGLGEKAHQISLMALIYGNAKRVIVWLGEDGNEDPATIDLAVETLGRAAYHAREETGVEIPDEQDFGGRCSRLQAGAFDMEVFGNRGNDANGESDEIAAEHTQYEEKRKGIIGAIYAIFSRSWFSRIWTAQELLLARTAVFTLGGRKLDAVDASIAASYLLHKKMFQEGPSLSDGTKLKTSITFIITIEFMSLWRMRFSRTTSNRTIYLPNVISLILFTSSRKANEPRDYIYGLLGMARDMWPTSHEASSSIIVPPISYERPLERCFADVIGHRVTHCRETEPGPLSFFILLNHASESSLIDPVWPSWVPRFHVSARSIPMDHSCRIYFRDPTSASHQGKWDGRSSYLRSHIAEYSSESMTLRLSGSCVGVIDSGYGDSQLDLYAQNYGTHNLISQCLEQFDDHADPTDLRLWCAQLLDVLVVGHFVFKPDNIYDGNKDWGDGIAAEYLPAFKELYEVNEYPNSLSESKGISRIMGKLTMSKADPGESEWLKRKIRLVTYAKRVFRLRDGRWGLGPGILAPGDQVYAMPGCRCLCVLRQPSALDEERFKVLGTAYMGGDIVVDISMFESITIE